MSGKKKTEFLMRTIGKNVVKDICVFKEDAQDIDAFIDEQDDERQILCVLCRISYQLENVVSALNILAKKKGLK